jgi:hypothetical protein
LLPRWGCIDDDDDDDDDDDGDDDDDDDDDVSCPPACQAAHYNVPFFLVRTKCDQELEAKIRRARNTGGALSTEDALEVCSVEELGGCTPQ